MLVTFGHGTAQAGRITELLRGAGVAAVIDIRTAPGSRRNPRDPQPERLLLRLRSGGPTRRGHQARALSRALCSDWM